MFRIVKPRVFVEELGPTKLGSYLTSALEGKDSIVPHFIYFLFLQRPYVILHKQLFTAKFTIWYALTKLRLPKKWTKRYPERDQYS